MELWMRSQDRTDLICINRIYAVNNQIRTKVYGEIGFTVLGEYKTKERALEVLDEIQEILKPRTIIKFEKRPRYLEDGTISDVLAPKECLDYNKQLINYVYEMPEE